VYKAVAAQFTVYGYDDGVRYVCAAKGKLKLSGEIYVGDIVEFDTRERIITGMKPRKNSLIRPYVANVDCVIAVVAPLPEPDFLLVDKIVINAIIENLEPIVCVNKTDTDDGTLAERVEKNYGEVARIVYVSAVKNEIGELIEVIRDKVVCLAGQSAAGKTSLVNVLTRSEAGEVGSMSEKLSRGRHTTRKNEVFTAYGALIIDTSGFSELNLPVENPNGLKDYYADFSEYAEECKYKGCMHLLESEADCGVKRAVINGRICNERYERYAELYREVNDAWKKRFL
jgi:ribosome biogenesis GTPase